MASYRLALILLPASLAGLLAARVLPAQSVRLENKLERPLLYLAQKAPTEGGEDVLSAFHESVAAAIVRSGAIGAGRTGDGRTGAGRGTEEGPIREASRSSLQSVQQFLSRLSKSSESSEMALVGLMNLGGQRRPLVIFHAQLRESGRSEILDLLKRQARPTRQVHGRQVYEFKSDGASGSHLAGIEIALVNRDLLVSNDPVTIGRVLDPRTSADGGFVARRRFQRLAKQLDMPPGSVMLYADWEALQPEIDRMFGDAGWLWANSGIEVPEQLMFVAKPAPRRSGQQPGIVTTILLSHRGDSQKFESGEGKSAPVWHHDGWLDLLNDERVSKLVRELPRGGVASLVSSIDVDRILPASRGARMLRLQAALFGPAIDMGINLKSQVVSRLRKVAGLQLLMVGGADSTLQAAYSLRAKNAKSARDLFDILAKGFTGNHRGHRRRRPPEGILRKVEGHRVLELRSSHGEVLVLSVVEDALVLAANADVIGAVRALNDKPKGSRSSASLARVEAIRGGLRRLGLNLGRDRVPGLVVLDLSFLARRFLGGDLLGTDPGAAASQSATDFDGVFGLQAGVVSFERDLVRLKIFTRLSAR